MNKKVKKYRFLRRLARIFLGILLILICLVLFVRSPWGQEIIVSKAVNYVSDKTKTEVAIERLFITFSGNIFLEGLYLEDTQQDTLVYSRSLEANIPISPFLFDNKIHLKSIQWEGLTANISRGENSEKFNYEFLLDAFVSQDTTPVNADSEPLDIDIGYLDFKGFNIRYDDAFLGINTRLALGELHLDASETDLETLRFELEEFSLSDTELIYKQTKPFVAEETEPPPLPYLSVENLKLKKIKVDYNSVVDEVVGNGYIDDFVLRLPKADLSKNEIEIDLLALSNSSLALQIPEQANAKDSVVTTSNSLTFAWPEFQIKANEITFEGNSINFKSGSSKPETGVFNPSNIALSNFNLKTRAVSYRPKNAGIRLEEVSFLERSGFQLRNASFEAELTNTETLLSTLNFETNSSALTGEVQLHYPSIARLIDSPELTTIFVEVPDVKLAVQDAFFFQPDLSKNGYVEKIAQKPFTGNVAAKGTLEKVIFDRFNLNWGANTSLTANGTFDHPTNIDSLLFDLNDFEFSTVTEDVSTFVSEQELAVSIPETILVTAKARGNSNDFDTDIRLKTSDGVADLVGTYKNENRIEFDGRLKVDSLKLNELLNNKDLGALSFTMNLEGSGSSLNTLDAEIASEFRQLEYKDYDFSNLNFHGKIRKGKGDVNAAFKDKNLNFTAKADVELDSINPEVKLNLSLIGADLYSLGVTKENIKVGLDLNADYKANADGYRVEGEIDNGVAVYDDRQYQLGEVTFNTHIDSMSTLVELNSDFLSGTIASNSNPENLTAALSNQFKNYFNDKTEVITVADSVQLKVDAKLTPNPILTEVFFNGIEQLDSVTLNAEYDALTKKLNAELHMPLAKYQGSSIDSLNVLIVGDSANLRFNAGLGAFRAEPIHVKKTNLEGTLENKELLLDFISIDEDEKVVHIASELTLEKDTTHIHVSPENLIFNRKEWSISDKNEILIAENFLGFENLRLRRNSQEISISNAISGVDKEHLGVTFENFRLQTFLSLLNPDEALASGMVNGNLVIENPFEAAGIVADFEVNALEVTQQPLGNLTLEASSKGGSGYDFNLALKDGGIDIDVVGDYAADPSGAELNLNLDLNRVALKTIEDFSAGAIKDAHGFISGTIDLSGTTAAPKYEGTLKFNGTDFNITSLNSVFKISEEALKVSNEGLKLNDFQITDEDGSDFTLDGSILTDNILNPDFDLRLEAEKFKILNSTKEDNELFYGTASLDADMTVKGNLELPKIEGKLRIRKITDVTYVVPESQLDVQERDGVVIFVNRENPDAILTRNDQEETTSFFQGLDVKAILEIAEDADFQVIIDERTGDNLKVAGDAELNLNIEPSGRIGLTGRYELKSGHYETNLYNLVKRRFELNPGSTITWQGDPYDAELDVTAIYELETSAAPLMSSVTSGQDVTVTNKYRQVLPFLVYLNVDGQILEPELSFGLDMPEDEQGALSGAVYTRVQQLNQQEAELNKQVFSLLALNRFYPDSGSDGSGGGTAAIARDNVNKVLSGELNAFSDKILGNAGFEVDFDLDSFTDYQGDSPQDRTQLNINARKKLFNDRLIVTAGSAVDVEGSAQPGQEETPIIGNVSLEYLLTKNGRYRLRGFRKSEYQNIIDGQLIVTGVALIFNREFNKFSQLFNPIDQGEKTKEKSESEN